MFFIDEDEIVIDYKLAKEIGATHIHVNGDFYKPLSGKWMNYPTFEGESDWEESSIEDGLVGVLLSEIKRTRTEYEKVTESIFDLRDEFERGELYTKGRGAKYSKCETWREFAHFMIEGEVYRKIEKEIDWRKDADSYFLKTKYLGIDCTIEEAITRSDYCDEFLELCRVALRANGEIE